MTKALYGIALIFLPACEEAPSQETESASKDEQVALTQIEKTEAVHSKGEFLSRAIVQFDIVLEFGGSERLNGTMTLTTNSTAGKIFYQNGEEIYYQKDKVFVSPEMENTERARFAAYTWSYFFLFPYKLSDPGTNWSEEEQAILNGEAYNSQKLTFGEGIGDAPDDWYITHFDSRTNLIKVAAYIVTAGETSVEEAEKDPHAISYHDYNGIDGIPLAHSWKFWEWRKDSGLTRQLGKAELSNFQFLTDEEASLNPPENFIEIE